jgi:hypothetical protein
MGEEGPRVMVGSARKSKRRTTLGPKLIRCAICSGKTIESSFNIDRPDEQLFYKRLPKKLEFGHTFVSSYKKHVGGAVKSIFWNPNTQ